MQWEVEAGGCLGRGEDCRNRKGGRELDAVSHSAAQARHMVKMNVSKTT